MPHELFIRVYALYDQFSESEWFLSYEKQKRTELVFDQLVDHKWGMLCLLSSVSVLPDFGIDRQRRRHFFSNLAEFMPIFAQQPCLQTLPGFDSQSGVAFWNRPRSRLFSLLFYHGVPESLLEPSKIEHLVPDEIVSMIHDYVL
ncbi:MAG: hypothetical protein AAGN35_23395 [Bacteroidota bacterium]